MPINKKLMNSLLGEYGAKQGKNVYYAMEQKQKNMKAKIDSKKKKSSSY